MVSSEYFSAQGVSDLGESLEVNGLPCPPFKKLLHPVSRSWSRWVLKKVYNIVPEKLVVEISIYSTPRGDIGKRESNLQS
jgi:hypothetical protein